MQEKIYLKKLTLKDISKKYLYWVNNPEITKYLELGNKRLVYSDLEKYIKDSPKQGRHNFAVITDKTKKHIGNCSIYSIKPRIKEFEIGWFIGEKNFWGGHYSSMIIFQLHKKGFVEMNLQKCIGYIDVNHIKARMTNIFSGYKEVGKLIKKKNNQSISLIKIEITKKDWLLNAKKLKTKYPELYEINNI